MAKWRATGNMVINWWASYGDKHGDKHGDKLVGFIW
jgi:hypothetical protein